MKTEVDEVDLKVLIGVSAYLTAHLSTGQSGDVTLEQIARRLTRDLLHYGLADETGEHDVAEAMAALTQRLHAAMGSA
ncbi:hypothetical protein [Microbacterium sp. 5K110]|jgi:hypothetical protein|uniref:hypothetical protein n=1 Tax=unclassified Microbacterium TaxID=2609290 RepID=UPI001484CC4B|nr:hypothetical protein [Microbacterium sp. 5K110]